MNWYAVDFASILFANGVDPEDYRNATIIGSSKNWGLIWETCTYTVPSMMRDYCARCFEVRRHLMRCRELSFCHCERSEAIS